MVDQASGARGEDPGVTLERLRQRLVRYGSARLSPDVAEDLAQETLLLLTTKYAHVTALVELIPLAITIMRLKIQGHRRRVHRRGEDTALAVDELPLPDGAADPGELLARRQALDRLRAALGRLGGRCAQIYRLKLEGRSFAEIGSELGAASVNTVYSWEFRCRQRLREILGGPWVPERWS